MVQIIFYEKPGCISNARQKRLLTESGHTLDVRNLLETPWSPDGLRPFFGDTPVADWFNKTAPRVKSGEVRPDALSASEALAELCADPILIRRPLMMVAGECRAGFDQEAVAAWIGLTLGDKAVTDDCPKVADQTP